MVYGTVRYHGSSPLVVDVFVLDGRYTAWHVMEYGTVCHSIRYDKSRDTHYLSSPSVVMNVSALDGRYTAGHAMEYGTVCHGTRTALAQLTLLSL